MKLFEGKTFWGLQKERRGKNIFGKVFKFTMYFLVLIAVFFAFYETQIYYYLLIPKEIHRLCLWCDSAFYTDSN